MGRSVVRLLRIRSSAYPCGGRREHHGAGRERRNGSDADSTRRPPRQGPGSGRQHLGQSAVQGIATTAGHRLRGRLLTRLRRADDVCLRPGQRLPDISRSRRARRCRAIPLGRAAQHHFDSGRGGQCPGHHHDRPAELLPARAGPSRSSLPVAVQQRHLQRDAARGRAIHRHQ